MFFIWLRETELDDCVLFFLDGSTHLYMRECPSVRRSVRRSVRPSVRRSVRRMVTCYFRIRGLGGSKEYLGDPKTPPEKGSLGAPRYLWGPPRALIW